MKRKLLLILFALIAIGAQAQNTLNVYQKDGTITCYAFSEQPKTVFSGADVVIKTTKTEITIPFSSILRYTFEDGITPSGVLSTSNADKASPVRIYTSGGTLVKTIEPTENGTAEASLDNLPAGVYIIYNGTTTYKFYKK